MSCYHPLYAYKSGKTANGKDQLKFCAGDTRNFFKDEKALRRKYGDRLVPLPCGKCIGCQLDKAKEWSVRCVLESLDHLANCFLTLTYDDAHVVNKLDKTAVQKFLKRLRSLHPEVEIRYFACGEHGTLNGRCHYHLILFGYDFPDKEYFTHDGVSHIYTSKELEKLWPFGISSIGDVSLESCAYVARYSTKKQEHSYGDEFLLMSRRPGLAANWFQDHKDLIYITDKIYGAFGKSHTSKPPRYFDKLAEKAGLDLSAVKAKRLENANRMNELLMFLHQYGRYENLHHLNEFLLASKTKSLRRYL